MAIDFPASPTVGQSYTFAGVTYTYTAQGVWLAGANLGAYAPIDSPLFTGDPKVPTQVLTDADTSIASTLFAKTAPRLGVVDGSNAAAGEVGEYRETTGVPNSGSGIWGPLGQNSWYTGNSLVLPPGDWDVRCHFYFSGGASWWYYAGISNGNIGSADTGNLWLVLTYAGANGDAWAHMGPVRLNIAATATLYWWVYSGYNAYYVNQVRLSARRMR